jgi:hypothetical protein
MYIEFGANTTGICGSINQGLPIMVAHEAVLSAVQRPDAYAGLRQDRRSCSQQQKLWTHHFVMNRLGRKCQAQ